MTLVQGTINAVLVYGTVDAIFVHQKYLAGASQ